MAHHHGIYRHHITQSDHFWFLLKAILLIIVVLSLLIFSRTVHGLAESKSASIGKPNEQSTPLSTYYLPIRTCIDSFAVNASPLIINQVRVEPERGTYAQVQAIICNGHFTLNFIYKRLT